MNNSVRAPFYDLFKLIGAILLLLIFLWIWLQPAQTHPAHILPAAPSPLPTSPTTAPVSLVNLSPTATLFPTQTSIITSINISTLTPTLAPSPTQTLTPVPESLPTPIVEIPTTTNVCESVAGSQLQIGMHAMVTHAVNFRSSPGVLDNWLSTNLPNTPVEVIGGPQCTRYLHGGSYLWWQIKLPNGRIGWSAEASAFGKFYFIEPVK